LKRDVTDYVLSCSVCNSQKKASVKAKSELGSYHAGCPMERVHLDVLGPFFPSKSGNEYVLVIIDQFTKWIECFPLRNQTAELISKTFVNEFISRYGCPLEIHTDQGTNFQSILLNTICDMLQIRKTKTTPYRPKSNGQVERHNKTITQMIRCYLKSRNAHWDENIPLLASAIRSAINRSTGFTPNRMLFGRETVKPIDLILNTLELDGSAKDPHPYVLRLQDNIQKVHEFARRKLRSVQLRQKLDYDTKLVTNHYEVGDLVYRLNETPIPGTSNKLRPIWKGPFIIQTVFTPVLYKITGRKKSYNIHHDKLKPYRDRNVPYWVEEKILEIQGFQEPEGLEDIWNLRNLFNEPSQVKIKQSNKTKKEIEKRTKDNIKNLPKEATIEADSTKVGMADTENTWIIY
jgi:hypothetical protein